MAIAILAFAVRAAAIARGGARGDEFGDASDYIDHARRLCDTGTYPAMGGRAIFRPPGFPFFIAAVTGCHPDRVLAIEIALALADSVTVIVIAFLAGAIAGTDRPSWLAALLAALHPLFVFSTSTVATESLFMLLLTLPTWLLLRAFRAPRSASLGVAGFLAGLAALTRPSALAVIPFWAVALALRRRELRAPLLLAVGATLAVGPWTLRNYLAFGEVIVVNDGAAHTMWVSSHPLMCRLSATSDRAEFARLSADLQREVLRTAKAVAARAPTPGDRRREWRRLFQESVRSDPGAYAICTLHRMLRYVRPYLDPRAHSRPAVLGSALLIGGLYVFGALGLCALWRLDRGVAIFIALYFLLGFLIHAPFHVVMRYRIPYTDPLLISLAVTALKGMPRRFAVLRTFAAYSG